MDGRWGLLPRLCRVCWARSPQNSSRILVQKCCHCSIHGARVGMGISLLQWRIGSLHQRPVYTLRLLHRECSITRPHDPIILDVAPLIGLVLLLAWVGAVAIWRYSSGGALTAFGLFPVIAALVRPTGPFILFSLIMSGLIVIKHRGNIERLWKGMESKMGERKN